jgi:hypothetical protein
MNFDEMVEQTAPAAPARRGLERRKRPDFVIAGVPTVSLLPREFRAAARDKSIRRAFVAGVIVALVLAGGATAGSAALTTAAQARLDAANARTQTLIGRLAKFNDVQTLQRGIALGSAATAVGSSTELDWQAQIEAIEQNMPADYAVTAITADSASAIAGYPQGSSPLEQPRAASLALTVKAPTVTELPIWLRKLRSITAYADATATVATGDGNGYSVLLTVHLSPKALIDQKAAK